LLNEERSPITCTITITTINIIMSTALRHVSASGSRCGTARPETDRGFPPRCRYSAKTVAQEGPWGYSVLVDDSLGQKYLQIKISWEGASS
jgi:hypothetical protein